MTRECPHGVPDERLAELVACIDGPEDMSVEGGHATDINAALRELQALRAERRWASGEDDARELAMRFIEKHPGVSYDDAKAFAVKCKIAALRLPPPPQGGGRE